ncbi:MAG: hypothetical protein QN174_07665 [Armatimonadota bacterium]|nr:hypothetical protein [Armatimonadota bacterium]
MDEVTMEQAQRAVEAAEALLQVRYGTWATTTEAAASVVVLASAMLMFRALAGQARLYQAVRALS